MAYYPSTHFVPQFTDDNGNLLSGGSLEAYVGGTSTPTNMFTDDSGTSAGAVITLNSRGEPEVSGNTVVVYLDDSVTYKFTLKTSGGVAIWTVDDVRDAAGLLSANLATADDTAKGADLVGYRDRTVHDRLDDAYSVLNYGVVGDGVADDTANIQTAIDAAAGRRLIFPKGRYKTSSTLTLPDNTDLYGEVGAVIEPSMTNDNAFENADTVGGNSDITIQQLTIDWSAVTSGTSDFMAIKLVNVTNIRLQDNYIHDIPVSAVAMIDCSEFIITDNRFVDIGTAQYQASPPVETGSAVVGSDCFHGIVDSNSIKDTYGVSIYFDVSSGSKFCGHISISDNLVDGSGDNGIRVEDSSGTPAVCAHVTIAGNTIIDVDGSGVRLQGSYHTCVGNNISLDDLTASDADPTHEPHGIHTAGYGHTITGNVIRDQYGIMEAGIKLADPQALDSHDIVISGNVIDGIGEASGYGINIFRVTSENIYNIVIDGNTITGVAQQEGMRAEYVDGLIINNNVFSENYQDGVQLVNCTNVNVSGNTFKNNNQENSSGIRGGLFATDCTDINFIGNVTYDDQGTQTQKYGITLDGTTDYVNIIGNNMRNNATGGYFDNTSGTNITQANNF